MMPPTSIDGTNITGATIDGTDVQEITVDGQTVFQAVPSIPEADLYHYDATSLGLADGDPVSSWADLSTRNADLSIVSGSPTYEDNVINGLPAVRYDGTDDRHESSGVSVLSSTTKAVFYGVFQTFTFGTERSILFNSSVSSFAEITLESTMRIFFGSELTGSTLSTSSRTFKVVVDGSNSSVQVDGGTVFTGTTDKFDGGDISIGGSFSNSLFDDMRIAEFVGYDNPSSQTQTDAETALSNKWAVTF